MKTKKTKDFVIEYLSIEGNDKKQTKEQLEDIWNMFHLRLNRTQLINIKTRLKVSQNPEVSQNEVSQNPEVSQNEVSQNPEVSQNEVSQNEVSQNPEVSQNMVDIFCCLVKEKVAAQVYMGLFQPVMHYLNDTNDTKLMDRVIDAMQQLDDESYYKRCGFDFEEAFWRVYDVNKHHYKNLSKYWN